MMMTGLLTKLTCARCWLLSPGWCYVPGRGSRPTWPGLSMSIAELLPLLPQHSLYPCRTLDFLVPRDLRDFRFRSGAL